jgi:hypothetical protein
MTNLKACRRGRGAALSAAVIAVILGALAGCTTSPPQPETAAPSPPPPPPPAPPPPVNLGGRWKLSQAGAGGCFMNFGSVAGADQGTIKPEGGCPGKFFTSRKWTFEHGALIIRDHKGEALAQLSFSNGRFAGQGSGGAELSLAR